MMTPTVRLIVAVIVMATVPAAASATDVTSGEFQRLAARSQTEPSALSEIRSITSVDGRPIDIAAVLDGADLAEMRARLATLAQDATPASPGAFDAQAESERVLLEDRFTNPSGPARPLRRPLEWLSDQVSRFWGWFRAPNLPGGGELLWVIGAIGALVAGIVLALHEGRRRQEAGVRNVENHDERRPTDDPAELERQAAAAEAEGNRRKAIRLRFRAGLIRLDREDLVDRHDSLTGAQLSRALGSPAFDEVRTAFDEVVYGNRPVTDDDVQQSKDVWPRVRKEVIRSRA